MRLTLAIVEGSEAYPPRSSSSVDEGYSGYVSGTLQTICAKSTNVYLI